MAEISVTPKNLNSDNYFEIKYWTNIVHVDFGVPKPWQCGGFGYTYPQTFHSPACCSD